MFEFFAVGNISLTSCDGSTKSGPAVNIDFYKINRTCNCIVTPSFVGTLLVTSRGEATISTCNTEINVQNLLVFGCPINTITSQTINVNINQSVDVRAKFKPGSTSGAFYHCLGFQQNSKYSYYAYINC